MSARFGRNQRRRAREQIAALMQGIDAAVDASIMHGELARTAYADLRKAQQELDHAKALAVHYSVLFPAQAFHTNQRMPRDGDTFLVDLEERLPSSAVSGTDSVDDDLERGLRFRSIPLEMLVASINFDDLRQLLHVNIRFLGQDSGRWAYGIPRATWSTLTMEQRKHWLMRQIPELIAHEAATFAFPT